MAQKCSICKEKVERTFLQKIKGTWVRDDKGKKRVVCPSCQRQLSLDEIRQKF
ncbi:hypothetical protein GF367_00425 [Candidatus Woesearchaeota archaeon]|nr:hypothetical protein [Candidatus Woesearchaeota archaeon]